MSEEHELVKYGRPYSNERPRPLWRKHSCTDIPCLLIFLAFLGGWAFIASYAFRYGDLNKLMVPTDSLNRKCGIDSTVLEKKYLFFFNLEKCIDPFVPLTGCPTAQVCVDSCPTQNFVWDTMKDTLSFEELKSRLICITDADKNEIRSKQDAERKIMQERCARQYIKSAPFLNRCMWKFSPQVCEYIPSFLLQRNSRSQRNARYELEGIHNATIEDYPRALAWTGASANMQKRVAAPVNTKLEIQEPEVQCRRRTELGETVLKEKMMQADTRLAKFVGNMVAYFYNGTHDAQQIGEAIVEDIVNSWIVVLIVVIGTLIVSLIFIFLLRWFAAPFLWFSILGVLAGLAVGIYYSIRKYLFWKNTATVPNHSINLNSTVKNILQESNTWLYLSIIECICLVVILLLVIVLRKRIRIAIALTKEGSKAVSSVISTVFFPIFSWVLFIVAIAYAVVVGLYLRSIGQPSFRMILSLDASTSTGLSDEKCICSAPVSQYKIGDSCDPKMFQEHCYVGGGFFRSPCVKTSCSFYKIDNPTLINWFIVYNIFGYLWITFFISAFNDMVLAGTFANWYWTFKKTDVPYFTLTKSFAQTFFYHLGTLAFGSLILAICRLIRLVLEYIHSKLIKYDNSVTRCIMCCMRCFFWLLESFLRFLNRNAYIMCAIHGRNFCTSAKDAFNLIMRNFLRVVTLDKVTDFLFFLSKVLLTGAAGTATYFIVLNSPIFQVHYVAVPITIVVIAAFLITSVFFSVYSIAVDTLFLCFLEDCERNDGTPEKPYYMSKQLMRILGKRNKGTRRLNSNESYR